MSSRNMRGQTRFGLPAWRPIGSLAGVYAFRQWQHKHRFGADEAKGAQSLHPYLSYGYIGLSVHIAPDFSYLYVSVPKNATTSVKTLLREMEGDASVAALPQSTSHSISHAHQRKDSPLLTINRAGWNKFNMLLDDPACFKFTFVRNPYLRMISSWQHQIAPFEGEEDEGARRFAPQRAKRRRNRSISLFGPAGWLIRRPSFSRFVKAICRQNAAYHDPHWMSQSDLLYLQRIRYDYTGKVENIGEGLAHLAKKLGRAPPALRDLNRNPDPAPVAELYTPELQEFVWQKYRRDFENFDYPRELPNG